MDRGGKLCISDGGSLWAGKLAVLLRLHHSRQVASCVRDLPQLGCGEMPVSVSAGLASEQKRVQHKQNRVVYEIEAQGRVYPVCS